jgi:hypothetical protein
MNNSIHPKFDQYNYPNNIPISLIGLIMITIASGIFVLFPCIKVFITSYMRDIFIEEEPGLEDHERGIKNCCKVYYLIVIPILCILWILFDPVINE